MEIEIEVKTNISDLKDLLDELETVIDKINAFEIKIFGFGQSAPESAQ